MELVSLKELCEIVNASRRCIQGYEKAGLMVPTDKNKYGYLRYDRDTVNRAKMIKFLQEAGFKLQEIKEIIDSPKDVKKEALERRVEELEKEVARLNQIIKEATNYLATLE